jgi:hypothetical protein
MRITVKTGVILLVSGIFLLTSFSGCGKKDVVDKWEDKELEKILCHKTAPIVLTDEERYEKENYSEEQYSEEDFWCDA